MALTLYYGSGSPFSWRVLFTLEHKQLAYEPRLLSFSKGEHRTLEYTLINPRRRLPAITDDDFCLYESNAITEYLEDRFPQPTVFPGDARARARVRRQREEADAYIGAPYQTLVQQLFFKKPEQRDRGPILDARHRLAAELEILERQVEEPFLVGELSAADFALYPFLVMFERFARKEPELHLPSLIGPRIRAWMKRIEALPYYEKTYPPHWRD